MADDPYDDRVEAEPSVEEALRRCLPKLMALQPHELLRINLDIPAMVMVALGALPAIRELRPEFERSLNDLDFELIDSLEDFAVVLNSAHAEYESAAEAVCCSPEALRDAKRLFLVLKAGLEALAERGKVERSRWKKLPGMLGYKNLGVSLTMLVAIFRSAPTLATDPVVREEELERASLLGRQLLTIAGRRKTQPIAIAAAQDKRQRSFTSVVRSYGEARAGALFVRRRQGDADQLVPSLFGGREYHKADGKQQEAMLDAAAALSSDSAAPTFDESEYQISEEGPTLAPSN